MPNHDLFCSYLFIPGIAQAVNLYSFLENNYSCQLNNWVVNNSCQLLFIPGKAKVINYCQLVNHTSFLLRINQKLLRTTKKDRQAKNLAYHLIRSFLPAFSHFTNYLDHLRLNHQESVPPSADAKTGQQVLTSLCVGCMGLANV